MKTGVLLINLGTPDSPSVRDVQKYLTQFLNDPLVIDINPIARFFLVNFIIVPFRAPKSAALYKKIWTENGSPLLIHTKNLSEKLQGALGENFIVEYGMRYQNPDIQSAFRKLKNEKVEKIIAVPLYPQYASSSTGSTISELKKVMKKEKFSNVKIIEHFFQDENFLNAWVENAKKYLNPNHLSIRRGTEGEAFNAKSNSNKFSKKLNSEKNVSPLSTWRGEGGEADFFLFSYHGLPERQITKIYPDHCQINSECCSVISEKNQFCYRAACYETTRQLVKRLNIPEGKYATSFQSRLDDKWLKPYSDKVVEEKAKEGIKRMLVFSPAFVADCLETIYEIGMEYEQIFKQYGGENLQLVESLNDSGQWVDALKKIILK